MGFVLKALTALKKSVVGKALDVTTVAFVHPVKTIQAVIDPKIKVKDVVKEHFEQPLSKQLIETGISTTTYVGAVLGAGAISTGIKGGTITLGTVTKALIPKTLKGAAVEVAVLGAGIPLAVGVAVNNPSLVIKGIEKVKDIPSLSYDIGEDIGKLTKEKFTLETGIEFLKSHPWLTASTAAAILIGVGYTGTMAANIVSNYFLKQKIVDIVKDQTTTLPTTTTTLPTTTTTLPTTTTTLPTNSQLPLTPQTTNLYATRKSYRRKVKQIQSIRQNVNVVVGNNYNKRYINERLYN